MPLLLTPQFLADLLMLITLRVDWNDVHRDVHVEVLVMETVVGSMGISDLDNDDMIMLMFRIKFPVQTRQLK